MNCVSLASLPITIYIYSCDSSSFRQQPEPSPLHNSSNLSLSLSLGMATASPASSIEWTWSAEASKRRPLELQLLPPSPFTAAQAEEPAPWGVDPSSLQQLMMGTSAASSATPSPDLFALFVNDDRVSLQRPLPSGWERCLDLESGEVFLKRSCDGAKGKLQRPCEGQDKDEKLGLETLTPPYLEWRQDSSFKYWLQRDNVQHRADIVNKKGASVKHEADDDTRPLLEMEPADLCLDLNLTLANCKRSKLSSTSQGALRSRASNGLAFNMGSRPGASDLLKHYGSSNREKPLDIQEMVKESTMVTAVCSKCLMYVLLRKSSPVCPRCSIPINLEGISTCAVSRKRGLIEFSSGDLLLTTDSRS